MGILELPNKEDHYETCPCTIQIFFSKQNLKILLKKKKFKQISLKTYIVGTRYNRLCEAVLTSTHNVCFESEIRKLGVPLQTPVFLYKSGVKVLVSLIYYSFELEVEDKASASKYLKTSTPACKDVRRSYPDISEISSDSDAR